MGSPTALMARPRKAGQKWMPALAPRSGGKIRLPAPKNMENSVKPMSSSFRPDSFCIKSSPLLCAPLPDRERISSVYSEDKFMSSISKLNKSIF